MLTVLAIDPGKEKCGLAVLDESKKCLERQTITTPTLASQVPLLIAKHKVTLIVLGSGTSAKSIQKELLKMDLSINIVFVVEHSSTLEARKLYWKSHPPKGLWRLIPTSLRIPPQLIDDFAAQVLGERFLAKKP